MYAALKATMVVMIAASATAACSSAPPADDTSRTEEALVRPPLLPPTKLCGIVSLPCCNGIVFVDGLPRAGGVCNAGAVCDASGVCQETPPPPACGRTGQACCAGASACTDPSTQCTGAGTGTCTHCGFPGEYPCNTGDRCAYGAEVRYGSTGLTCVACGGLDQTCCRSVAPDKETGGCRVGECNGGTCRPCGGDGQTCCFDGCMQLGGAHTCQAPNNTGPVCLAGTNPPDLRLYDDDNDCLNWDFTLKGGHQTHVLVAIGKTGDPPNQTDWDVYTDRGLYTQAPRSKCLLPPQTFIGLGYQECDTSYLPFDDTLHCPGWQSYVRKTPANLLTDGDFELGTFGHTGPAVIEANATWAASGTHDAFLHSTTEVGYFEVFETVKVKPHTKYHFTGYMDYSSDPNSTTYPKSVPWGVRDAVSGVIIQQLDAVNDSKVYGDGYSQYPYAGMGDFGIFARHAMDFDSGSSTSITVYVGYTANGHEQFVHVDNLWLSEVLDR